MKNLKKILALVTALALTLALALPALAADGDVTVGDITVPALPTVSGEGTDNATHTYTIYQVFKGTWGEDNALMAVEWGNGVNASALVTALTGDAYVTAYNALLASTDGQLTTDTNPFKGIVYSETEPNKSADAVARVLSQMNLQADNSLEARAFAQVVDNNKQGDGTDVPTDGVTLTEAGYYLTVDTVTATNGQTAARSLYILSQQNKGTYKPTPKASVPQLDKKVMETNDTTGATEWKDDVADYDIGDHIPFVLTGTVSARYDDFKVYKYVFTDTLSAGLTLDYNPADSETANTFKVFVNTTVNGTTTTTQLNSNQYAFATTDNGFTVTFADLKQLTDVTINGTTTIQVLYTATLNENATTGGEGNPNSAKLTFSNDPNSTDAGNPPTGDTPEDKVTVFTFKLVVNKVGDTANSTGVPQALTGAKFSLWKEIPNENATSEEKKYVIVKTLPGDGQEAISTFTFDGLDAGNYKLVEDTAPAGYNKAEDMYFTVIPVYGTKDETTGKIKDPEKLTGLHINPVKNATGNEVDGQYAATNEDGATIIGADGEPTFPMTGVVTDGTLTASVLNLHGLLLPSTGGIGTTIFYVVGGLLVLGAGVLLITKKRMGRSE